MHPSLRYVNKIIRSKYSRNSPDVVEPTHKDLFDLVEHIMLMSSKCVSPSSARKSMQLTGFLTLRHLVSLPVCMSQNRMVSS
jgi:hypothetical protein